MRELDLIERIRSLIPPAGESVVRGPGDDAAVITSSGLTVVSTDQTVAGVHADMRFFTHRQFGARAVLAGLSDLSAMGVAAGEVLIAAVLDGNSTEAEALSIFEGALAAAGDCGASLIGGDIVVADHLCATVTVTGHAEDESEIVTREGALDGHLVGVTGELGASGAGLAEMRNSQPTTGSLAQRHLNPVYRGDAAVALAACPVSAMIDISDGLATDAAHLGRASSCVIEIEPKTIPVAQGVDAVARVQGLSAWEFAVTAGEDFELLFTVDAALADDVERAVGGLPLTWIGEVRPGPGGASIGGRRDLRGWEHASKPQPSAESVPPSEPGPA